MEVVRTNVLKSSLVVNGFVKNTITTKKGILEYSSLRINGYGLTISESKKYGYVVHFGCQKLHLELFKEIINNLNGIFKTVEERKIKINNKVYLIKDETEKSFITRTGIEIPKQDAEILTTHKPIKRVKKIIVNSYWHGKYSYYQYNGRNVGRNSKLLLKVANYCVAVLEELNYLNNIDTNGERNR